MNILNQLLEFVQKNLNHFYVTKSQVQDVHGNVSLQCEIRFGDFKLIAQQATLCIIINSKVYGEIVTFHMQPVSSNTSNTIRSIYVSISKQINDKILMEEVSEKEKLYTSYGQSPYT